MSVIQSFKNPFPGIRSFEPEEDYLFFGRDKQLRNLIPKLYDIRFLAITGASGCGKSSLVRAGLIPSLFKNKYQNSEFPWTLTVIKPGSDPVANLAQNLFELFKSENCIPEQFSDPDKIADYLAENNDALLVIINMLNSKTPKNRLLFIDQFEEIFRHKQSDLWSYKKEEIEKFLNLFLFALHQNTLPVYTVITMRSDFLGDCTDFTGLPEVINKGHYLVSRMTDFEKEEAIREPIAVCNGSITDQLVERLIADLGDDPDQLPVMQHALMRTWDYWLANDDIKHPLDVKHYEAIGTMKDAISLHAENVYNNITDPKQKYITEKIFKSLISVGRDDSGRSTRRPTQLSEICQIAQTGEDEIISIIDRFRAHNFSFLLPLPKVRLKSDTIIDITHESIMRKWTRLREWIDDEIKSAQLYQRLSKSSELYQEGKAALWKNPELQVAVKWQETNKPNAVWASRYNPFFERALTFLNYSREEYERELSEKENRQKRELKRARRFALILGTASAVSLLFLIISLNLRFKAEASEKLALEKEKLAMSETRVADLQRIEATVQKRISEQQQQIAEQQRILTEEQKQYAITQQQIALQQKQEAVRQRQLADAAKTTAILARDEADVQRKDALTQKKIADEERIKAEKSEQNTMRLRLLAIARSMAVQSSKIQNTVKGDLPLLLALQAYVFNIKNSGNVNDPEIFNALNSAADENTVLRAHQDAVRSIALSPDGKILASASEDGTLRLWDVNDPAKVSTVTTLSSGFRSAAFSSDGHYLCAGTSDGKIILRDLSTRSDVITTTGHSGIINFICFDKTGRSIISADNKGTVRIRNLNKISADSLLHQSFHKISAAAYNRQTDVFAAAFGDGTIKYFNISRPNDIKVISGNNKSVSSLAFNEMENLLAAGYTSGVINIWDLQNNNKIAEMVGHASAVNHLQFSGKSSLLSSVSSDRTIRLWDFRNTENLPVSIDAHDSWIWSSAFNPDATVIYSAGADKTIRKWLIDTAELSERIKKKLSRNMNDEEWNKYVSTDIKYEKTCPELP